MAPQAASTSNLIIHYPKQLWLGLLSKDFPHASIQITAFVPIEHDPFVGNSMISIRSVNVQDVIEKLETYPSLISYSVMEKQQDTLIISAHTKDNLLLRAIVKNGLLVHLPVKVSEGTADFIINGSRGGIDNFISDLNQKGIQVDIKSLGHFTNDIINHQLTTKQHQVYFAARKAGYYDKPRKITLTGLAEQLGMAKSSLSTMLQRIHNALLGN